MNHKQKEHAMISKIVKGIALGLAAVQPTRL
jgi:hypothetical protein